MTRRMTVAQIQKVSIAGLSVARKRQMLEIAEGYYRDPESGLNDELQYGNLVYYVESTDGALACFVIVDFDHHQATIANQRYQFSYLGLGCAKRHPMVPVFQQVKSDFAQSVATDTVGVLHLTTRTPFAYRSFEKAFGKDVFPTVSGTESAESMQIASYIKSSIHNHTPLRDEENPFLLRQIKKGQFNNEETVRIRSFKGETPISQLEIDCSGSDELIVFHTFAV